MTSTISSPPVAECLGVKVPASPYLTETRIARINAARYEGQEIAGALHVIGPDDRVIEMGAGLGIVGAVTQLNARPAAMVSFEANPNMIPHIKALYALNRIKSKIRLHNKVLLTEPEPPESVDFFLRSSFLGSSLTDTAARDTTAVSVPTTRFEPLRKRFKPTVLLMDIEGGELAFLRHANLEGIRAIVLEFHPEAYGKDGMRECKDILRKAGFSKVNEVSTRLVWTCLRGPDAPHTAPDPETGWSRKLTAIEGAIVVPPAVPGLVQPTGVLTAQGDYLPQSALWRRSRPLTEAPAMPQETPQKLAGTWLWGGQLWLHFGHFLAESTPRLWGLGAYAGQIDGIIFTPKRPRNGGLIKGWQRKFFAEIAPNLPLHVATAPTEVERLIIPGQGFGLGAITRGTPEFRSFIAAEFGKDIVPDGPEKLYISRSKFEFRKGSLVGETELEAHLAAQGYEIFHPQEHDIKTQIARYKAAKYIIAAEGSAIHMAAMVMGPQQKLAIVVRRRSSATHYIESHLHAFAGVTAHSVDALVRSWMPEGETKARHAIGEIDFPSLQAALHKAGFISAPDSSWENFPKARVQALLGAGFRPV